VAAAAAAAAEERKPTNVKLTRAQRNKQRRKLVRSKPVGTFLVAHPTTKRFD